LSGLVRLAAGRVLAERFLIDRLRTFHERYPAIDLEVMGGFRVVSLAKREADVALRYGSPKDSELVARRVATIRFGPLRITCLSRQAQHWADASLHWLR
jgi:DNA-binding transcriptional LysR family regulator